MNTVESKGIVQKVIDKNGEFLVAFPDHDGYFQVPESSLAPELKEKIFSSQNDEKEITFVFDKELNILKIL